MPHSNPHHERRWAILAILGLAQLMVVLDATIVNIALPSAQKALHFSNDNRQWIVTAYSLAFGSLLLLGGKISDLFGRKWTFVAGLVGLRPRLRRGRRRPVVRHAGRRPRLPGRVRRAARARRPVAADHDVHGHRRAQQGVRHLRRDRRQRRLGRLAARRRCSPSTCDWRFSMYVNLVFAAVAVSGAMALLHNQAPAVKPRIDIPGVLTVTSGLFALVYGFNHAQTDELVRRA